MKKYLVLTSFLSFTLCVCAQKPIEELSFYQKQAQEATRQTQQALVDNLELWLDLNATLPEASKALILKGNLEKNLRAYPESIITLLRYKYEFSNEQRTNVQSVLQDFEKDFPKNEQAVYKDLIKQRVPQADLPKRLDTFLNLATKANLKGTYQPIVKEYNSFFKRFKDYGELDRMELMFGDLHRSNKNPYAALMQYQKVWEVYPDTKYKAAALRMQGDVYAGSLKDYEKAKAIYEKVLNDFPNSVEKPTTYYHLALIEGEQKEYNEALSHLNFATKLYQEEGNKEDLINALFFKAEIQEKKIKDYTGAAETLKELSSLVKNNEQQYIQTELRLADLCENKLKDISLARKAYEDIIKTYPNSKQADKAVFEIANLAKEDGEYQMAASYLEKLIVNNPDSDYAGKAQRQLNSLNKKIAKDK